MYITLVDTIGEALIACIGAIWHSDVMASVLSSCAAVHVTTTAITVNRTHGSDDTGVSVYDCRHGDEWDRVTSVVGSKPKNEVSWCHSRHICSSLLMTVPHGRLRD